MNHMVNKMSAKKKFILIIMVLALSLNLFQAGCAKIETPATTMSGTDATATVEPVKPPTSSEHTSQNTTSESIQTDITTETVPSQSESTTVPSTSQPVETTAPSSEEPDEGLPPLNSWNDQQIAGLNGTAQGWSFNRPVKLNADLPATITSGIANLISPFAVVWQLPQKGRKTVYLTMDEGYEYNENTTEILDIALRKKVPITFFITDYYIESRPDLVIRMADEGHLVANHTVSHPNLAELLAMSGSSAVMSELTALETKYKDLTGLKLSRYIRPPMGAYSQKLLAVLNTGGFYPVFWSYAYRDWLVDDQPDPTTALAQILGELHDGSVILIHAVSKTNVQILPELIDGIRARGYEPVALPAIQN